MTEPPPEQPQQTPPGRPAAPSVGPLALEAALLLDVVADRLESMKTAPAAAASPAAATPTTDNAGPAGADEAEPTVAAAGRCPECGSVPGASCTACPLCRFMALLRGERPEATAKLVDGALMIIRTLRTLVPDPPAAAGAGTPPPDQPPPAGRRGGLERIDIL